MILLAISGKRKSGKSFLADMLANGFGFKHLSFAKTLKAKLRQDLGLSVHHTDGALKEVPLPEYNNKTPRQLMIEFGGFYRTLDSMFWVKELKKELLSTPQAQTGRYVIADLRFKNEANWVKEHGGKIVRLNRDESLTGPNIDDLSETGLDNYDKFDLVVPAHLNRDVSDMKRTVKLVCDLCAESPASFFTPRL